MLSISAQGLPAEADFVDNGNGSAQVSWVPGPGTAGAYDWTFTVTDDGMPPLSVFRDGDVDRDDDIDRKTLLASLDELMRPRSRAIPPMSTRIATSPCWMRARRPSTAHVPGAPPNRQVRLAPVPPAGRPPAALVCRNREGGRHTSRPGWCAGLRESPASAPKGGHALTQPLAAVPETPSVFAQESARLERGTSPNVVYKGRPGLIMCRRG
jgi:hypothetical protein